MPVDRTKAGLLVADPALGPGLLLELTAGPLTAPAILSLGRELKSPLQINKVHRGVNENLHWCFG